MRLAQDILYICVTCRPSGHDEALPRPGQLFFESVRAIALKEQEILPMKCLLQCDRPCAAAMVNAYKNSYLLSEITPMQGVALLEFFASYVTSADGFVPFGKRPKVMRAKVKGKIPPAIVMNAEVL